MESTIPSVPERTDDREYEKLAIYCSKQAFGSSATLLEEVETFQVIPWLPALSRNLDWSTGEYSFLHKDF